MEHNPRNFVHLHMHTEYSTLDGINRVDSLPEYITGLGQDACAITDHGNISGSYKFYKSCIEADVKPIIGMEAYYTVNDRSAKEVDDLEQKYYHLVLLAMNKTGLRNLYKLSSRSFSEGMYYKPRLDDELLSMYNEDIIATSACLGSRTSQLILRNKKKEAEKLLDHHAAIFKDRFFIEVQLHEDKEQQEVNKTLVQIARTRNWPLLLTNDCHYTEEQDKRIHEVALCIQTNDVMSNENRFSFGEIDVHVAHHDWMWARAQKQGIPYEAIMNSRYIANLIQSETYFEDRMNRYPKYENLPDDLPSWDALERLSKNNLTKKFGGPPPIEYQERLAYELKIIKKMGFYDYLLIVWEYLKGARDEGILVGFGRGSAPASLVAYALDITRVDPIKYGLVFERWLNYGRAARPLIFDNELKTLIENQKAHKHHGHCNHS